MMRIRWTGERGSFEAFEVYSMPNNPQEDVADDAPVYARGECVEGRVRWLPGADLGQDQLDEISEKVETHLRQQKELKPAWGEMEAGARRLLRGVELAAIISEGERLHLRMREKLTHADQTQAGFTEPRFIEELGAGIDSARATEEQLTARLREYRAELAELRRTTAAESCEGCQKSGMATADVRVWGGMIFRLCAGCRRWLAELREDYKAAAEGTTDP